VCWFSITSGFQQFVMGEWRKVKSTHLRIKEPKGVCCNTFPLTYRLTDLSVLIHPFECGLEGLLQYEPADPTGWLLL
jgi:hypothetical protein